MNANELAEKLEDKDRFWNVDENLMIKTCAMLRQQQAKIEALYNLVKEQDKKIIDLAFKLAYAERSNEIVKEAKYGITTKWDKGTTYHETIESIGKTQK